MLKLLWVPLFLSLCTTHSKSRTWQFVLSVVRISCLCKNISFLHAASEMMNYVIYYLQALCERQMIAPLLQWNSRWHTACSCLEGFPWLEIEIAAILMVCYFKITECVVHVTCLARWKGASEKATFSFNSPRRRETASLRHQKAFID